MKLKRLSRIVAYTISMYLVTHLIVFFYLFPIGTFRIFLNPESGNHVKKHITGLLFKIIGKRLIVNGLNNIDPGHTYLIISNYPGSYAGFALMNVFPEASILVHSFLSRVPLLGFLLKATGASFVQSKRFGQSRKAIDAVLERDENKSIIILPEGGRSPDGSIHKFHKGFIYILRHSSRDLLPVTLKGFYSLKPLKRPYLDPDSELEVVIHKPIEHSELEDMNNEKLIKSVIETISGAYKP